MILVLVPYDLDRVRQEPNQVHHEEKDVQPKKACPATRRACHCQDRLGEEKAEREAAE